MKIRNFLLTIVFLFSVTALTGQAASIDKTAASLNADAQKPGGPERVLKSISASMHVSVATLEKEKAKGLSYGDLYAAHAIANASGKSFSDIAALKKAGKTWDKIAEENNVSLDGKKKVTKTAAASPTPKPALKSMAEEQRERFSQKTEITNQRPAKP